VAYRLLGPEDQDGRSRPPRIRDLHQLALRHCFHPRMGGRTSIKVVLPAVWESGAALRKQCNRRHVARPAAVAAEETRKTPGE
jgi:hypothetical protein